MKKLAIIFIIVIIFIIFIKAPSVEAVSCTSVPISGSYTVSSSCEFSGTVNGVDAGTGTSNTANITVNSGQTLTISAGQTVVFGGSITINGSISIVNTGQIRQTALWMTDADVDGYASSTTQTAQATAPANGRRRNLMTSITSTDCLDSDVDVFQNIAGTSSDNDQDGYTDTSAATNCVGTSSTISGRTYYIDTAANSTWLVDSQKLGTSDCLDSNANVFQNIAGTSSDNDQDGYTDTSAATNCVGTSTTVSARTYYKDTAAEFAWLVDSQKLGTSDCNDSYSGTQTSRTQYTDSDGDGYTAGSSTQCTSSSTWATSSCSTAGSDYARDNSNICVRITSLGSDCNESVAGTCPNVVTLNASNSISDTSFNSAWTAATVPAGSGAVTGYKVYRCLGSGCTPTTLIVSGTGCCNYNQTGLACGVNTYRNKVLATNSAGDSADSNLVDTTTNTCYSEASYYVEGFYHY